MESRELSKEEFDQRCAVIDSWVEKEGVDPLTIYCMLSKHLEDENGHIKREYSLPLKVMVSR